MSGKGEFRIAPTSAWIGFAASFSALLGLGLLWKRQEAIQKRRKEKALTGRLFSSDPLLALCGSGKRLWADEHADEYVARLRQGWGTGTSPDAN
jgi:hypothetical protein